MSESQEFSELKFQSLDTLDKIKNMTNNMLKGISEPFDESTISSDCVLNKLVSNMTTIVNNDQEMSYVDAESDFLNLISSIKQTVDGLNNLITATKEMSLNGSPFIEVNNARIDENDYTNNPPKIPYIELWGKCSDSETDAYLETTDGNKSYKGNTGIFFLKLGKNNNTKPKYSDYINPVSKEKQTVTLCLNGVHIKDENDNDITSGFKFDLESSTVEIKKVSSDGIGDVMYANVNLFFVYPTEGSEKYPKNFFRKTQELGKTVIHPNEIEELSFTLRVIDNRHDQ